MEENALRKDLGQVKHGDNIIAVIRDLEVLVPNQVTLKLRTAVNHNAPF